MAETCATAINNPEKKENFMNIALTSSALNGRCHIRLLAVGGPGLANSLLSLFLQQAGYDLEVASDGHEAIQLTQLVRWDALMLDLDLPGMNGRDLYARILCNHEDSYLPVLFVTGRRNQTLELGLQGAAWARLIYKPFDFSSLVAALEHCLCADDEPALTFFNGIGPSSI
jgi:CheY-like chemotaxis protein